MFFRAEEESIGDVLSTWGLFPPWDGDKKKISSSYFQKVTRKKDTQMKRERTTLPVCRRSRHSIATVTVTTGQQPTHKFRVYRKRRGKRYGD